VPTGGGPPLHVTNGDSVAATLARTRLGGEVLPWRDVLHEGPAPAGPRRALLEARARFLATSGWGGERELRDGFERRDRRLLDALGAGTAVVLWFEHDLYDQLQLLDVLTLVGEAGAGAVEGIVVGAFPGRPRFRGLGELEPGELAALWNERREVPVRTMVEAAAVWQAFVAPEPTGIAAWATRGSESLPFLGPALSRLLEELPATTDGLSGTERRLLAAIAAGARTSASVFVASQERELAPFLGDVGAYRTLAELGSGDARLVETVGGDELPTPPPRGDLRGFARLGIRLTPLGERVLQGTADRVALLGLDRWLGGTHLTTDHTWRWSPREARLVAP